jgi:hypothetical protein
MREALRSTSTADSIAYELKRSKGRAEVEDRLTTFLREQVLLRVRGCLLDDQLCARKL